LLKKPAATSSITIPTPPENFLSKSRIGYGFQISSILNKKKPAVTEMMLKGRPVNVKIMPAISSITIQPGSLRFSIFSASWAIHIAHRINIKVKSTAAEKPIFDIKKQSGSPRIDPKVPGAKEIFPIKQPVARNMTNFCLKFMACLYSLSLFLSRNSICFIEHGFDRFDEFSQIIKLLK